MMKNTLLLLAILSLISCSQEPETIAPMPPSVVQAFRYKSTIHKVEKNISLEVRADQTVSISNMPTYIIAFETPSYCGIPEGKEDFVFSINDMSSLKAEFDTITIYHEHYNELCFHVLVAEIIN